MNTSLSYYENELIKRMYNYQNELPLVFEAIKLEYLQKENKLARAVFYAIAILWRDQKTVNCVTIDTKATLGFQGDYNDLEMYIEDVCNSSPKLELDEIIDYIIENWRSEEIVRKYNQLGTLVNKKQKNYAAISEMCNEIDGLSAYDIYEEDSFDLSFENDKKLIEFSKNKSFEKLFRGIIRGNLNAIAAEPGMGKTTMGIAWTDDFLESGYTVVWFFNDGEYSEFMGKWISLRTSINSQLLVEEKKKLRPEEKEKAKEEYEKVKELYLNTGKLYVKDKIISLAETRLWIRKTNPDVAFIDTLQGMEMPGGMDTDMAKGIPVILKGLKQIAKQKDLAMVPIVWIESGGSRPRVDQIYASKDLRRRGAKIWMLYYPYNANRSYTKFKNIVEIIDGKQRFSGSGYKFLSLKPEYGLFYPLDTTKAVMSTYANLTKLPKSVIQNILNKLP